MGSLRESKAARKSAFEDLVAGPVRVLAADGNAGAPGDRGQAGVGGHVRGGGEVLAGEFGQEPCGSPDAVARHGHQDRVKRVVTHELLDPRPDVVALSA
jgi:hypothetical protein